MIRKCRYVCHLNSGRLRFACVPLFWDKPVWTTKSTSGPVVHAPSYSGSHKGRGSPQTPPSPLRHRYSSRAGIVLAAARGVRIAGWNLLHPAKIYRLRKLRNSTQLGAGLLASPPPPNSNLGKVGRCLAPPNPCRKRELPNLVCGRGLCSVPKSACCVTLSVTRCNSGAIPAMVPSWMPGVPTTLLTTQECIVGTGTVWAQGQRHSSNTWNASNRRCFLWARRSKS